MWTYEVRNFIFIFTFALPLVIRYLQIAPLWFQQHNISITSPLFCCDCQTVHHVRANSRPLHLLRITTTNLIIQNSSNPIYNSLHFHSVTDLRNFPLPAIFTFFIHVYKYILFLNNSAPYLSKLSNRSRTPAYLQRKDRTIAHHCTQGTY